MSEEYEQLADRAERGELRVKPGTARGGSEASRAEVARMLMEATETTDSQEAVTVAMGRPRAGMGTGPSPVVRARVPEALKESLTALAKREQRKESEVVREALAAYISTHQAS